MQEELVILVDAEDNEIGLAPKMQAHRTGDLHRAISVFLLNSRGEMLLQRRAFGKYHSSGLWSNACCSHPRRGESPGDAAARRLREEMGISCDLQPAFRFTYRAELEDGLVEHELDHVFVGRTDDTPHADPEEVGEWRWVAIGELQREMRDDPDRFTAWFHIALPRVIEARATPDS
jgi:isopentenyl-diphosphate Delta-isomerase